MLNKRIIKEREEIGRSTFSNCKEVIKFIKKSPKRESMSMILVYTKTKKGKNRNISFEINTVKVPVISKKKILVFSNSYTGSRNDILVCNESLIQEIKNGRKKEIRDATDCVCTNDLYRKLSVISVILGKKGLMPSKNLLAESDTIDKFIETNIENKTIKIVVKDRSYQFLIGNTEEEESILEDRVKQVLLGIKQQLPKYITFNNLIKNIYIKKTSSPSILLPKG